MQWFGLLALLLLALSSAYGQAYGESVIGRFSAGDWQDQGWQRKEFSGQTTYTLKKDGARQALHAESRAAGSGLYREISIDLRRTPYLNWSWRVDNVLTDNDEKTKSGDDFPARVYVVVSGGALFWKTRALVYVWSSHQPVNSAWHNPFTDNSRLIAVRSGRQELGRWLTEKRNIRADFKRLYGADIDRIDAVAIMTDTDNSGQSASAWYGDIFVSAD